MFKSATVDRASAKSSNPSPFHTKNGRDTFIQPKVNIGKANDKCEVEADAVADRVVYKTNASKQSNFLSPASTFINHTLQKKEEVDDLQESSIASHITPVRAVSPVEDESVQKKPKETNQEQQEEDLPRSEKDTDEDIQTKMETSNPLNFDISQRLQEARGNGRPLSTPVLKQMQNGFGANFGNVLIHTDAASITMNKDLGARAFTNRHHIFFNEGEYQPTTVEGQFLLAHELTHTIQQGAAKAKPTANSSVASDDLVDYLPPTVNTSSGNAVATNYFFTDTTAKETLVPIDSQETQTLAQEPVVTESLDTAPPETETEIAHAEEEAAFPQSAEEDPAFNALQNRVEQTAAHQQATNPVEQEVAAAQGAASVPSNERLGSAQANQVAVMEEQEAGEFDAVAFKARLMERIGSMQLPTNQDEATDFENHNNIQEISNAASQDATQAQQATAGPIAEATEASPNVDQVEEREVISLPEPPIGESPAPVNASSAMPNARPESQVAQPLQENMQEVDQEMIDNEVTESQLVNSNEPTFTSALDSRNQARAHTETAPGEFRQQESQSLSSSQQHAETTSLSTLEGMHGDRANIMTEMLGQQIETGAQNTAERERIANEINGIYESTKTDVEAILEDLDTKVSEKFDTAAINAKRQFEDYVAREMDRYKDRRYSGLIGAGRWIRDKFAGLPEEVNQFFVDGRALYIAVMDKALTDISNYIGERLTEAKNRIQTGKQNVTDYVEELPENLQALGKEAADGIQDKFDQLTDDVNSKQDELIDSLAQQYNDSLTEVDARIEEMKAANRGFIDMALDAIKGVIETIQQLKQLISDLLSEVQSSIAIIMADPIGFVSNLFEGVKQGFNNFTDKIQTYLISGFVEWLTGALGPMGITIPENLFSLKGIFSLVMQVLGLTWDYIRAKAVKLLGEPVVKAMEFGLEMFQIIREKGVEGIWEYIKEQFADLKETIIYSIKDLLIVQVIQAGIKWLVGLLVPGGGFIKAIMAIKDFIVFFVESALMLIPTLIEAIRAMAAGSMSLVANAVEKGLATLLPLVIKLFARIIGLGGLVGKVQKIIMKIRSRVDKAINKLILKAKKAARKLLNLSKDNGDIHAEENDLVTPQLIAKIDASSEHFTMDGKPHDIYLVYNKGNIEVEMASDFRERLLLKIDNALFEIKDKEGTEWNKLRQNFKSVKDKLNDYEWDISALLDKYHQDTDLTLQKLREQIRSIGQELRIIGDAADIESLKFIGHSSNYVLIDGELDFSHSLFSGLSGGRAIRKKLYPDWSSSIIAWRNKRLSTDYNGGPYGRRDPLDHNNFISEEFGNREPNQFLRRTIKNQNVASVPRSQVSIDHKKSVAYHWENESGKDTNQSKRNTWYNDDKNLRLISGALNSSLGSGGETFDSKVGDKFLGPNE